MAIAKRDSSIARFILRLKHWQIFSVLIGFRIVDIVIYPQPEPIDLTMTAVWFLFFFAWLLLTGFALHKRLSYPLKRLWIGYWVGFVLFFCYVVIFGFFVSDEQISRLEQNYLVNFGAPLFVLLCLSSICIFFASALNKLEAPAQNRNREIIGDFFLFLFWPIGIWMLQPRLNKLIDLK